MSPFLRKENEKIMHGMRKRKIVDEITIIILIKTSARPVYALYFILHE
jgi:hypothetical protein